MKPERARALAVASLLGGVAASLAYVVIRVVERLQSGPMDPTAILVEAHVAFYWRALTSGWWGVLAFGVAYAVMVRRGGDARATRWVHLGAFPFAVVVAVAMWLLP